MSVVAYDELAEPIVILSTVRDITNEQQHKVRFPWDLVRLSKQPENFDKAQCT